MNIIFFGSSKYATIVEEAVEKTFGLSLVVTIPDKPIGRKQEITPSPVKQFAIQHNIPVLTTEKLGSEIINQIKTYVPDFLVVADYGLIIPTDLLKMPKYAPLNVHHSLLPKYRGPSPAPAAILAGEKVTGVSIIVMGRTVDSGDILAQKEYAMKSDETTDSLLRTLNILGAELLMHVLQDFKTYYEKRIVQDESQVIMSKMMRKADGFIDSRNPPSPEMIDRMIRAYYPWPGAHTQLRMKHAELRIKLLPGKKMQPEGKKPMTLKDFFNGYPETKQLLERLLG